MPLITEIKKNKDKISKFKKKDYRPWDINFDESITNQKVLKNEIEAKVNDSDPNIITDTEHISNLAEVSVNALPFLDLDKEWRTLYGAKKRVFIYILNNIDKNESEIITKNITQEQLIKELTLPANTIKGALQQLKKLSLLFSEENKPGRGGYARYKIQKDVFTFFKQKIETQENN